MRHGDRVPWRSHLKPSNVGRQPLPQAAAKRTLETVGGARLIGDS
jgi:hypothetical protein